MRLDYGTQLSPTPITLSIGTLRKPTLKEISEITFEKFNAYEYFLMLSPETYYTEFKNDKDKGEFWKSLTEDEQNGITVYDVITKDDAIRSIYIEMFNFFFVEKVIYHEGFFILLKENIAIDNPNDIEQDQIRGVIAKENISQVINLLQQICCINDEEESEDAVKFKNNIAKKIYEKMSKAKKENKKTKKADVNLSMPNIISAISNKHPSLNYLNIWDLTIFQLLDSFEKLRGNSIFEIDCTRISVWGDKDKKFDPSLWYRNNYDTK